MTQRIVSKDLYTRDLFGDLILPERLSDLCYSFVPELSSGMTICLTGYFDCARGNIKRVEAMQKQSLRLQIDVTENWRNDVDILVVGDRAKIVSLKIKNAVKLAIPIVREKDFLEKVKHF